jgi:hypothetical protein
VPQISLEFSSPLHSGWKDLKRKIELDSIFPKEGGQHAKSTLFILFLPYSILTPYLCLRSAGKTSFEPRSIG